MRQKSDAVLCFEWSGAPDSSTLKKDRVKRLAEAGVDVSCLCQRGGLLAAWVRNGLSFLSVLSRTS